MVPIITSPQGQKTLLLKYGSKLNWKKYLQSIVKANKDTTLMISKLENQDSFQEGFIKFLQPRFEALFIHIHDGIFCVGQEQKDSAQNRFNNLQKIYEKLYPHSDFSIDKLMNGKYPYDSLH